ncbi:hypothetical protein WJX82_011161 [Trebouxia sp. C0006]
MVAKTGAAQLDLSELEDCWACLWSLNVVNPQANYDYIRGMPRLQFVTVFSDYGTFYSANLRDGKLDVNDLEQQMPFDNLVLDALNGTPLECDSSGLSYLMGISRRRIKSRQVRGF